MTRPEVDVFDREKRFIDEHLTRVVERFPTLKVVFEHITTGDAAAFVKAAPANVGATITAHHLLYNRNHMLRGHPTSKVQNCRMPFGLTFLWCLFSR